MAINVYLVAIRHVQRCYSAMTNMVRSEGGGRSCHCGGKSDTGSTGPGSIERGHFLFGG